MNGLLVFVYRSTLGDCTNNGVTNRYSSFVLTRPGVEGPFEARRDLPELRLISNGLDGKRVPRCVPVNEDGTLAGVNDGRWGMFGGNFVYTSDSRFPYSFPIPVFDRFE